MKTYRNAGYRHSHQKDCRRERCYASAKPPPSPPPPRAGRNRSAHDQSNDSPRQAASPKSVIVSTASYTASCHPSIAILTPRDSQRHACGYAESLQTSQSGESMHSSPSHSPTDAGSPNTDARHAHFLGRLSLDNNGDDAVCAGERGRHLGSKPTPLAPKRSASSELAKPGSCQLPRVYDSPEPLIRRPTPTSRLSNRGCLERPHQRRPGSCERLQSRGLPSAGTKPYVPGFERMKAAVPRDSGYESDLPTSLPPACQAAGHNVKIPSTLKEAPTTPHSVVIPLEDDTPSTSLGCCPDENVSEQKMSGSKYDILLQPASSPISQDQLAAEVKGIYAGLVMVEAKCINICAAQTAEPTSQLGAEQWQALIALHRTLLYEHHDFLMATQHPSATQALRGLAIKYSMPARMWKHGIHAFLEVLRHRRPESQDYMLAFIYLAYQMIALLFETVPSFTDTWIECLGDLARYRMAIEEEREAHATWGGVASRWYTLASDRHPAIGRLYHHLGILERPSLRKYCYYSKSLTCVMPFPNARDSLATLCGPIVQDSKTIESSRQSAEARIVTYHALVVVRRDLSLIDSIGQDCLHLLKQNPSKLRDFGANLAITNIATQFELGASTNTLWQLYTAVISENARSARPSHASGIKPRDNTSSAIVPSAPSPYLQATTAFTANCINFVLEQYDDPKSLKDCLPFVHVSITWLHSLQNLRQRVASSPACRQLSTSLLRAVWFDFERLIDFSSLAGFLNTLLSQSSNPITRLMRECARKGDFLVPDQHRQRPLPEDFIIRGLIWSQSYFPLNWFDGQSEDDGRNIETEATSKARIERILWLGLYLASWTDRLQYDIHEKVFSAIGKPTEEAVTESSPAVFESESITITDPSDCRDYLLVAPGSRGSTGTTSSSSNSEDGGWQKVKKPRTNALRSSSSLKQSSVKAIKAGLNPIKPPRAHTTGSENSNDFAVVDENGNVLVEIDAE